MRSHFSTLSKYFPFFILVVSFSAGSIVGSARTHFSFSQTTSSSPVASILSASENWGLSFQEEGKRPVGNATIQELAEYHAFFAADTAEKKLYLTFDCGYENGNTPAILAALKKHQAPAVFFAVGNFVRDNPDLIKQMVAEGHIVGNHTVNHKSMPTLSEEQINSEVMDLHKSIYEKFGYEMKYIRPPMGEFSEKSISVTNSLGYKTVMWSFAYKDWEEKNQPSEQEAIKIIVNNFHSGEIMLLHGNSKTNTNILKEIINQAKNQEYTFASLDEYEE